MAVAAREPTRPAGALTVDLLDGLEPLREDWTRLAAAARNVFATWEWNELWWRHYGRGRRLQVAVARRGAEVEAIVPLFVWSERPVGILRLLGHGHGDRLGPICDTEEPERAAQALRAALAAVPHDLFVGDWLAGDRAWAQVLGGRVLRTSGYPILRLDGGAWEDFLAARSHGFRKSVRHSRNRLLRHQLRFRMTNAETLERDLDDAFRLHRDRFGRHACRFCGEHEPFQRDFARIALAQGRLRLLFLELDGEPVACDYAFLFEGAYFAYQGGRDLRWERESLGFVLEVETIRRTLEEGAEEYRYLGGDEPYKYRFAPEDPRLETVVAAAAPRGRLAAAAVSAVWRLPGGEALVRRVVG